jgi:hypothetical protein
LPGWGKHLAPPAWWRSPAQAQLCAPFRRTHPTASLRNFGMARPMKAALINRCGAANAKTDQLA